LESSDWFNWMCWSSDLQRSSVLYRKRSMDRRLRILQEWSCLHRFHQLKRWMQLYLHLLHAS